MPKPPSPTQFSYRGRIRADIRSAYRHLQKLNSWNNFFNGKPMNYYPNQLWSLAIQNQVANAITTLNALLFQKGPIPSR